MGIPKPLLRLRIAIINAERDLVAVELELKAITKLNFGSKRDKVGALADNFMNNLSEGKAALILKELPGNQVKGSFRTTRDDVDVSAMAKALGGGGHKKAAGFTVEGNIDDALKQVWEMIENLAKFNKIKQN